MTNQRQTDKFHDTKAEIKYSLLQKETVDGSQERSRWSRGNSKSAHAANDKRELSWVEPLHQCIPGAALLLWPSVTASAVRRLDVSQRWGGGAKFRRAIIF